MDYLAMAEEYESTIKNYESFVAKKRKELSSAKTEYGKLDTQRKIKFYEHLICELKLTTKTLRDRASKY
jgi:hypothetical protein